MVGKVSALGDIRWKESATENCLRQFHSDGKKRCLFLALLSAAGELQRPKIENDMRAKGKLTSWNEEKKFGFITPMAGGKQFFIHIKAFSNRNRRPAIGQIVTYEQYSDKRGRPRAIKATLTGDRLPEKTKRSYGTLSIVVAVFFLIIVGISALSSRIPLHILALYMAASLLTFIMYALDKSAAKNGTWRIQESTLHLLSLVGGWPGALIAQQKLRHKTKKQSFRSVFWITVLLNCVVFVWLLTPNGTATLQSLIGTIM